MSELKEGTFKACLTDWGVTKFASGTPAVVLEFAVEVDDDLARGEKLLFLTDKAKQGSIQTLYKLGFNGKLEDLAAGRAKNALTGGTEVRVVVKNETYEGDTRAKIAFVNLPDEVHGLQKMDAKDGAQFLDAYKADFLSYKPVTAASVGKKSLKLD